MNSTDAPPSPHAKTNRWLALGWALILVKCLLTPWAVARWNVPVHPGWVIWPTLGAAAFITVLVLLNRRPRDDDQSGD